MRLRDWYESDDARRIRRIFSGILLLAVCGLAVIGVVLPLLLGAQSYTVLTGSMRPSLQPGALIAVRPTDAADIRIGEVITFQLRSGEPEVATHRVVAVGFDGRGERVFTTRGDANDVEDVRPVRAVQIRGVLVYAVPWIGYLNIWATPSIKSVLIVVLGAGAVAWGVMTLLRDTTRRRRAALAAPAVLLVTCLPLLTPVAPAAAAEQSLIQVSADGTTWTPGSTITLFDVGTRIVPGDTISDRIWVRSTAPDPGTLTVIARWHPTDTADAGDKELARALTARADAPGALSPGQIAEVGLELSLPGSAQMRTARSSSNLIVNVQLVQETYAHPLPRTGAEPSPLLLLGGATLVLVGAALATTRRRHR